MLLCTGKKIGSEGKSICCNISACNYVYSFKIVKTSTLPAGHFVISMKRSDRLAHCFSDIKDDCLKSKWFPFNSHPQSGLRVASTLTPQQLKCQGLKDLHGCPCLLLHCSWGSKHTQPPPKPDSLPSKEERWHLQSPCSAGHSARVHMRSHFMYFFVYILT